MGFLLPEMVNQYRSRAAGYQTHFSGMTFTVEWDRRAAKKVEKLPQFISFHVLEKVDKVAQDPFRYLEHFEGEKVYKLRIGDYRALVDIDLKEKIIFIRHFDHRHRVYDR